MIADSNHYDIWTIITDVCSPEQLGFSKEFFRELRHEIVGFQLWEAVNLVDDNLDRDWLVEHDDE